MPQSSQQNEQVPDSVKERAKLKIERDLGPDILAALADPKTIEIMLNAEQTASSGKKGSAKKCSR